MMIWPYELANLHNKPVGVDDSEEWGVIHKDWVNENVAAAQPVLGQVISSTGSHVTFRHIPTNNNATLDKWHVGHKVITTVMPHTISNEWILCTLSCSNTTPNQQSETY